MPLFDRKIALPMAWGAAFLVFLGSTVFAQDNAISVGGFDALSQMRSPTGSVIQPRIPLLSPEHEGGFFEAVNETTYVVGPGDYFQIFVGGKISMAYVNSEGVLSIEGLSAPVPVGGKSLRQAKEEIRRATSSRFRNESIHVTLAQAKAFQVSLLGEVVHPGFHTVPAGTRLTTLLDRTGGFTFQATRRLRIVSASGEEREVDLGEYFRNGDLSHNPYLNQGDRIYAPGVDLSRDVVYVRAENGLRAMQVEPGENLESILRRQQNFRNSWEWLSVRVFEEGDRYVETVERKDASRYVPRSGTILEPLSPKRMVFVGGMVLQPGYHAYNPAFRVQDYIALAGVTVSTGKHKWNVQIIDAEGKTRKATDANGQVFPGDHILVPRSGEAATRDYVTLFSSISGVAVALATFYVLVSTQ